MTRLSNSLFLTEKELLDDENYAPGLLYHGNILLHIGSTVNSILSVWNTHPTFSPSPLSESRSIQNHEISFAEYLRTWWYPVWRDIFWDDILSIESYVLGKRIVWEHPIGEYSHSDTIAEIDDILSVFKWSETYGDGISESTIENIHHIILRHISYFLQWNTTKAKICIKSGNSLDVIFFIKNEQAIWDYLRKQSIDIQIDFYKKILYLFQDIFRLEWAIEKWECRTYGGNV
jgi:hypothetical protein